MLQFLEKNFGLKLNKQAPVQGDSEALLLAMRRRIIWQAGLAALVLILTIVIVFAMTAAWSTNVVQTSGLQFQAEAWGFDREITVLTDPIAASPGDEGYVTLNVTNDNQDAAAIHVAVSKAEMDPEIQKRLYFFVDTEKTRNSETVSRVYLNSRESHTYILPSGQTLSLTEQSQSDAPLKWYWVYDVLGYYVRGTSNGDGTISVSEYLRPIEYNYDTQTTVFATDDSGVPTTLESINGKSVGDFLRDLSAHDGYPGQIDPDQKLSGGWYPVDVDENGDGVYAYLCSYSEIEAATDYDTALGAAASAAIASGTSVQQYQATLTISAENYRTSVVSVASLTELEDALAAGMADTIRLTDNVTLADGCTLRIPADSRAVLDLNGNQIISEGTEPAIEVEEGASLTLSNGSLQGSDGSTRAVYAAGAELTMQSVEISGFEQGLYIEDNASSFGTDSCVYLKDCTIDTVGSSLVILGNGSTSAADTTVVLEDCTIYSDGVAISGNGSATELEEWGTDITITGCTIVSDPAQYGAGIYHPQMDSTLTIENSTISGYTGIAVKGGTVEITDCVISGLGEAQSPSFNDSGFAHTGDGIYIETNYGYDILLTIAGDTTVSSDYGQSLQVYASDASHVTVRISSGTFDQTQPDAYIAEGSVQDQGVVTIP